MTFSLTAAWVGVNLVSTIAGVHGHADRHGVRHANRVGDGHLLLDHVRHLDCLLLANPFGHANLVRLDSFFFDHAAGRHGHLTDLVFGHHTANLHCFLPRHALDYLAASLHRHLTHALFLRHANGLHRHLAN